MTTQEDVALEEPTLSAEGGGRPTHEEGEEEEEEGKKKEEEEATEKQTVVQDKDPEVQEPVTSFGTGRSHYRGGVSRRAPGHAGGILPPRVIVTSSDRQGQLLDDIHALDRNLPPPRLLETPHPQQSGYRVNYPGAKLRVGAPRPSHLTNTQGVGTSAATNSNRNKEPYSINFGSSSLSTGAYHHPRVPGVHDNPGHVIPREPVRYYSAGVAHNPHHPPPPRRPLATTTTTPSPPPYPPPQRPQRPQPQPPPPAPPPKLFRPSKLLPPTTLRTATAAATEPTTTHRPQPPTTISRTFNKSDVRQVTQVTPLARDGTLPQGPDPTLPRRGQVVNAPRPVITGLVAAGDSTSSLTPLGSISKSGVRAAISHRAGPAGEGHQTSSKPIQRRPSATVVPSRHPVAGYARPGGNPYNFVSGEVYTPPPLIRRTKHRNSQKPFVRITTRRPLQEKTHPVIPFKENHSTHVPKYAKDTIAEMEFEPKTFEAPHPPMYHNPNWFLMPVQGWFVLSIILAALLIVLIVVCAIIYNSLRKQRKKVRKLLTTTGLVLPPCVDPVKHEMCQCRSLAPLVRSHTLMSRASIMSRASHRSLRPPSRHQGAISYESTSQSQQMTTGFRSLPSPTPPDQERDNNQDSITTANTQLEVDETPPPLAPKKSSMTGSGSAAGGGGGGGSSAGQDNGKSGSRESRLGNPEGRSFREGRMAAHEARSAGLDGRGGGYDGRYGSRYEGAYDGRGGGNGSSYTGAGGGSHSQRQGGSMNNPDVQLTTIYPPPRRFEL